MSFKRRPPERIDNEKVETEEGLSWEEIARVKRAQKPLFDVVSGSTIRDPPNGRRTSTTYTVRVRVYEYVRPIEYDLGSKYKHLDLYLLLFILIHSYTHVPTL